MEHEKIIWNPCPFYTYVNMEFLKRWENSKQNIQICMVFFHFKNPPYPIIYLNPSFLYPNPALLFFLNYNYKTVVRVISVDNLGQFIGNYISIFLPHM